MRFTQDQTSSVNVIRGYGEGELRINDQVFHGTLLVDAATIRPRPDIRVFADLELSHVAPILQLQPELVLLGTGRHQVFPSPRFGAQFLQAGIGFEVMDTGAACRTFNVLVGEHRRVVALLLLN